MSGRRWNDVRPMKSNRSRHNEWHMIPVARRWLHFCLCVWVCVGGLLRSFLKHYIRSRESKKRKRYVHMVKDRGLEFFFFFFDKSKSPPMYSIVKIFYNFIYMICRINLNCILCNPAESFEITWHLTHLYMISDLHRINEVSMTWIFCLISKPKSSAFR